MSFRPSGSAPAPRPPSANPQKKKTATPPSEANSARKTLIDAGYLQEDRHHTLDAISTTLGHIAADGRINDELSTAIKACTTLLIHSDSITIANLVASAVRTSLISGLAEIPGIKELGETAKTYRDFANEAGEKIESMGLDVSNACARLSNPLPSIHSQQRGTPSYAEAARSHPPLPHLPQPATDYGAAARRCQVLIEGKRGGPSTGLKDLNEKQIVAKAQTAIELMGKEGIEPTENIEFIGAICLKHGGVVLRLSEEAAADWVKENRELFLAKMGGSLELKDRACTVVASFVPISFDPSDQPTLRHLEITNRLPAGSILSARYIKAIERREPHQAVATVYIDFKSEEAANTVIRHKMWIENKHIFPFKKSPQVQRCYKCQKIGVNHTAAECKAEHDICGYCSENHRGSLCNNRDKDKSSITCTNCHRTGHGPGSRQCQMYHQAREHILTKNPAWSNPFYTTSRGDFGDVNNSYSAYAFDLDDYSTPEFGGRGRSQTNRPIHPLPRKPRQTTLNFAMIPDLGWADAPINKSGPADEEMDIYHPHE